MSIYRKRASFEEFVILPIFHFRIVTFISESQRMGPPCSAYNNAGQLLSNTQPHSGYQVKVQSGM